MNYAKIQKTKKEIFFLGALFFLMSSLLAAADIQIGTELSRHRVPAGEMVQLDVKVIGAQEADVPHEIAVDGLQIRLAGQSSQMEMVNFQVSSSALYSYIVMPLRSGTFTIPAIQVRADGKYFKTTPQQLTVEGSSSANSQSAQAPLPPVSRSTTSSSTFSSSQRAPATKSQIAFGELSISKSKLYVGEVVPAEIRFYVDARYNAAPRRNVDFSNEGLLVERLSDPVPSTTERNGILYNVLTFHTFISAVKPGSLNIGPATMELAVEVPITNTAGMPDLFSQLLGSAGVQQHPMTLKSNKVSLEALPLPTQGCPESFSGAIGVFQMDAMALPQKYALGDPINLAITIEGEGNFKAISTPQFTETNGWKIYPSSDRIDAPDTAGLHGIKTFETTMIAQEPKTTTPGALFSYFNPNTGKYVTLTAKPLSLQVIPSAKAPAAASTAAATPLTNTTTSSSTPDLSAKNRALTTYSTVSWKTPLHRTEYLLTLAGLLGALVTLTLYLGFQSYQKTETLVEQQELKKLFQELESHELDASLFFSKAATYAERLLKKDPSRLDDFEEIFRKRDEIAYGARETLLRAQDRQKILEILSQKRE